MQDMGAAGICCSTSEMSAKGKSGMTINLDYVPLREQDMSFMSCLRSINTIGCCTPTKYPSSVLDARLCTGPSIGA
jgi:phosphoribosylformylglycinamidine synthase